jgi:hypothetical protein
MAVIKCRFKIRWNEWLSFGLPACRDMIGSDVLCRWRAEIHNCTEQKKVKNLENRNKQWKTFYFNHELTLQRQRELVMSSDAFLSYSFIVIKAGTSIVTTPLGYPSLSRMASIVEHVSDIDA